MFANGAYKMTYKKEKDFLNLNCSQMSEIEKFKKSRNLREQLDAENFQRVKAGLLPYVQYLTCTKLELISSIIPDFTSKGIDTTLPQQWLDTVSKNTGHYSKYYDVLRFGTCWNCFTGLPEFLTQDAKNAFDLSYPCKGFRK